MSMKREDFFKQIEAAIADRDMDDITEAELDAVIEKIISEYNASVPAKVTEATVTSVDDWMKLAITARSKKKALEYAKKAEAIEPDNLDVKLFLIEFQEKTAFGRLERLSALAEDGAKQMQKLGFATKNAIGHYWGIFETRSYMAILASYADALIMQGMYRKGIEVLEKMLYLCENDNLGARYKLMHMYVLLEEEKKALALHKKFGSYDETQMLLPLSVLYFKKNDFVKATYMLYKLADVNKYTKRFLTALAKDLVDFDGAGELSSYTPFSYEEFLVEADENGVFFALLTGYVNWALEMLKKKRDSRKVARAK